MFAIQDETDLLSAVHDGPFEQPMWSTFLDRLRQRTRADHAGIMFLLPEAERARMVTLHAGHSAGSRLRALFTSSPASLREERVYAAHELAGMDDAARVVRVREPGGLTAWISVTGAAGDFTSGDAALLSRVAPHFRRALRSYAEIERQKARANMADSVMARLNFGWIGLDAQANILSMSENAASLLSHDAGLVRTARGRLVARDASADRRLSAAIRALGATQDGRPRALNISQDPWVDLLLVPATRDASAANSGPAIIAYIQGDNRSLSDRHEQIAELFGLLPSEARFALLLGRGLSIAEASEKLGLTLETGRNYSKKIYAKTGARGQADLVRFLLTSVLSLA